MGSPNNSFWDDVSSAVRAPVESALQGIAGELEQALETSAAARRNLEFLVFGMMKGVVASNLKLDAATSRKLTYLASSSAMATTMPALLLPRIRPFTEGFVEGLGSGVTSFVELLKLAASGQLTQMFRQSVALLTTPAAKEFEAKGHDMGRGASNALATALARPDWEAAVVRAVGRFWGEEVVANILTGGFARLFSVAKIKSVGVVERGLAPKLSDPLTQYRGLDASRSLRKSGSAKSLAPDEHPARLTADRGVEQPAIREGEDAFVDSSKFPKQYAGQDSFTFSARKLNYEEIDGVPQRTAPNHAPFTKAFTEFLQEYENALAGVWDRALANAVQKPTLAKAYREWMGSHKRLTHLMDENPMLDKDAIEAWMRGRGPAPTPPHQKLAEQHKAKYHELLKEVEQLVKDAKKNGGMLYDETRSEAIRLMPAAKAESLRRDVNRLSALNGVDEVVAWTPADIRDGRPPRVRGKQNDAVEYRPLNLDHEARRSDNPWRSVDFSNLRVTFAKDNQVLLERVRNKLGQTTNDEIVQWLYSLRSKGSKVSPQYTDPKQYGAAKKAVETEADWEAAWREAYPSRRYGE